MVRSNAEFMEFIRDRIDRSRGYLVPTKASLLEVMLVRNLKCTSLYPNPDDEFCDPAVGPSERIISEYMRKLDQYHSLIPKSDDEPLMVEKVKPSGYMILNGHHRWAAAMRADYDTVPVRIVNLTHENDIVQMLRRTDNHRRVTMDLDEVVFCQNEEEAAGALPFPLNIMYKERIRFGMPALLHDLSGMGYDIWVYSAKYYSNGYIRAYFRKYGVKIDGIVTGTVRRKYYSEEEVKRVKAMFDHQYEETLHIDNSMILRTKRSTKEFEDHPIDASPTEWSDAVRKIIKEFDGEQHQDESIF